MLRGIGADLRFVFRILGKSRGFTAVAVLSLAIGIGLNASIVSVVRGLLLDPLPVSRPDELALVYWSAPTRSGAIDGLQLSSGGQKDKATGVAYNTNYSYPAYQALVAASRPTVQLFGFNFIRDVVVGSEGQPSVVVGAAAADGRYFSVLRVGMALGRPIVDADDRRDAPRVAVISHQLWHRAFGGDPAIVGRHIRVSGIPVEVVGVSVQGFTGLSKGGFFPQTDITVPLTMLPDVWPSRLSRAGDLLTAEDTFWVRLMGRVTNEGDRRSAEQALTSLFRSHLPPAALQDPTPPGVALLPGARGHEVTRPDTQRMLLILTGVVGLVLVIACANLASLMLARGVARQREITVRRALGASRLRLARHLLTESLVLSFAGGGLGLLLAGWSRGLISTLLTSGFGTSMLSNLPLIVRLDSRTLALTTGAACVTALIIGLLPALRLTRVDPGAFLKHQTIGTSAPKLTFGRALIALQIAISLPLLAGAVLLLKSAINLAGVDAGFNPRDLIVFRLNPAFSSLPAAERPRLYTDILTRTRAMPGVTSATLVENPLLSGITSSTTVIVDGQKHRLYMNAVGPEFLETMGMRLVGGRALDLQDHAKALRVAMVNEAAVRKLFGGAWPVGRRLELGSNAIEIVGVVGDTLYRDQRTAVEPILFDSALQRPGYGGHHVVVRTALQPGVIAGLIQRAVAELDRSLPIPDVRAHLASVSEADARARVFTQMLVAFGSFALLLASIGLYGVTAYSVTRRTNEIGVRVAFGASPGQLVWLVLREVALLALAGVALGLPLAMAMTPLVASLLFEIAPRDPWMIAASAAVLIFVALVAGLLPARRAARMDPLVALRTE
jgi:predicted permease